MQFGKAKPLNLLTLTHFQLFFQWPKAPKKEPKSLPKWSLWAPKITKKTEKQTLKKHTKKWMQKLSKKEPKRTTPFVAERSPKSQKSEPWAQNVPQASRRGSQAPKILKNHQKMSPRASKITQNHENLVTQNQENPRKKTSRNPGNKDAARWRVMRAAHWIPKTSTPVPKTKDHFEKILEVQETVT